MSEPVRIDNATGETPCLVRWMVETPAGWLGAWDREAFDAYTEPLRLRLAEAVALLREALPAVQSYARKHGRAVVAAARRNDADHAAKHAAVEQSAWGLADKIRAYLPPDSASVEGKK